jgi:hypothetical protein
VTTLFIDYLDTVAGFDMVHVWSDQLYSATHPDNTIASLSGSDTQFTDSASRTLYITGLSTFSISFVSLHSFHLNRGFLIHYYITSAANALVAALAHLPSPPLVVAPPAVNGGLCSPILVMHGASYYTFQPKYITNDLAARRRNGNLTNDGSSGPIDLPHLPSGDASEWLVNYAPYSSCDFEFRYDQFYTWLFTFVYF